MVSMFVHFVGLAAAVYLLARLLPGVRLRSPKTALLVAAVYGLVNFGVKLLIYKVFFFVSIPLLIVSLGLFGLVVNAAALKLTDVLLEDFEISSTGALLVAAAGITATNMLLGAVL